MPSRFEELGRSDRATVSAGVEALRVAFEEFYQDWVERNQRRMPYVDRLMIGHNFYKLMIVNIAREMLEDHPEEKSTKAETVAVLLEIAISTLKRTLEAPIYNETDPDLA